MSQEGDEPVRCMANHYAHDVIKEAAALLFELTHINPSEIKIEYRIREIESALKQVRFNLGKPAENAPDR